MLNDFTFNNKQSGLENFAGMYAEAKEAIIISSKTNWYYPSKKQYPEFNKKVYCEMKSGEMIIKQYNPNENWKKIVKCWSYLPKHYE